ncbi:MAG: hypothetical protein EBU90_16475 [Proteobacteria bacterium]|nr:hypothetical protein [Pseudomonadota bacterium]NBP14352.1 hypothetical protein [bacterium]
MNKIIFWLLVVCMATKDLSAVLPGAVFAGTLAATVASLKIAHYHQKKAASERQAEHLALVDSFKQEDWQKFRNYPHAAKMVKKLFERRNLSPKDFNFRWCQANEGWSFNPFNQYFNFQKLSLEKANELLSNQDFFSNCSVTIRYEEESILTLSIKEYINLLQFIIGHEIQHACDSKALEEIHSSLLATKRLVAEKVLGMDRDYFSKHKLADIKEELDRLKLLESEKQEEFLKEQRFYEKKADINACVNPEELRIGAKYYQWDYERIISKDESKWEHFFQHEDEHPHPLERARYLRELANELEKKQQEKQAKQAQFKQEYLVLPN